MIRVFLDPRLYTAPATARRGNGAMGKAQGSAGGRRTDDGTNMIPVAAVASLHETIPEAVPAYNPGQPMAPNPYDVAAMNYTDPVHQGHQPVEMQAASMGYDQYGRPLSEPYVPPHVQSQAQSNYSQGSAALDVSHNPYATGEARAGAFEQTVYVDAYGNPIQPQSH